MTSLLLGVAGALAALALIGAVVVLFWWELAVLVRHVEDSVRRRLIW